ncbi:MAG: primosomal protein N' [Candidatus Altimarinota bacterium]
MRFYHLLFRTIPQLLTYQSEQDLPMGSLVKVSIGKRTVHGIVMSEVPEPTYECVTIQELIIPEAITLPQIELCKWMSGYYYASLQKCVQLFIPSTIWNHKIKPKKEGFFELTVPLEQAREQLKRSKKQLELLESFAETPLQSETLLKQTSTTAIINALVKKGILIKKEGELLNPDLHHRSKPYHDQPLTSEQQKVLKKIESEVGEPRPSSSEDACPERSRRVHPRLQKFLLHGITGSGKTEIYLQLIKKNIEKDLQTILLVPEIALTTELIQYFTDHFPDQISIVHSHLSEGERVQSWHRIHQGKTKLVLGSRSALFTPWKQLGGIIIDEEHEWTYKQESSPRYHAKTVAERIVGLFHNPVETRLIASLRPAPFLVLGSATPSIESYFQTTPYNLQPTTYNLLSLTHRANLSPLPPVTIVDLRDEYKKKNTTMFSDTLKNAIQKRLEKKEQVILFLNKRGASSSITCRDCGYTPRCPNCDIAFTYHAQLKDFSGGGLICHYCGTFEANLTKCPKCFSVAIRHLGSGTQKAEEQLKQFFPSARILRADKDTTSGKYDFEAIYHQMKNGDADLLIGTQMIAKGLDLPNITLTGIIIADIGLHLPDFRANERVFQLLTQVAGRSGRHKPGEVIIQTYQPYHPSIQAAKNHDYSKFYQEEIQVREALQYPPFSNLIKLIYAHEDARKAEAEAKRMYQQFMTFNPELSTINLSPHYIPRLHGKYIWNIFIRGQNPEKILKNIDLPPGWKIDVDPR